MTCRTNTLCAGRGRHGSGAGVLAVAEATRGVGRLRALLQQAGTFLGQHGAPGDPRAGPVGALPSLQEMCRCLAGMLVPVLHAACGLAQSVRCPDLGRCAAAWQACSCLLCMRRLQHECCAGLCSLLSLCLSVLSPTHERCSPLAL